MMEDYYLLCQSIFTISITFVKLNFFIGKKFNMARPGKLTFCTTLNKNVTFKHEVYDVFIICIYQEEIVLQANFSSSRSFFTNYFYKDPFTVF